jgi:hypothetical protein
MSIARLAAFIADEPDFDVRWRLVVEFLKEYHREPAGIVSGCWLTCRNLSATSGGMSSSRGSPSTWRCETARALPHGRRFAACDASGSRSTRRARAGHRRRCHGPCLRLPAGGLAPPTAARPASLPHGLARAVLACAVRLAGVLFELLECGLPDLLMLAMGSAQLVVGGVLEREQ